KQDQYAAAFGGVNIFSFSPDGTAVTPLSLCPDVRRGLEAHLALYFTGSTRQARAILQEQRRRSASGDTRTIEALHALKAQVAPVRAALARLGLRPMRFGLEPYGAHTIEEDDGEFPGALWDAPSGAAEALAVGVGSHGDV